MNDQLFAEAKLTREEIEAATRGEGYDDVYNVEWSSDGDNGLRRLADAATTKALRVTLAQVQELETALLILADPTNYRCSPSAVGIRPWNITAAALNLLHKQREVGIEPPSGADEASLPTPAEIRGIGRPEAPHA